MSRANFDGLPALPALQPESLTHRVAEAIRILILDGRLPAGTAVPLDRLADQLSVSTMPVREALLALSVDRLVVSRPHRSFLVARRSTGDMEDVWWVRGSLMGELAARAVTRSGRGLAANLRSLNDRSGADRGSRVDLHEGLAAALEAAAGSPMLSHLLARTARFVPGHLLVRLPGSSGVVGRALSEIARAGDCGDGPGARAAGLRYVKATAELLAPCLAEDGSWAAS